MGYTTDFTGAFKLDKPLIPRHAVYLSKFSETRRMKRNADLTATRSDAVRESVELPVGPEGCYFVEESGEFGQNKGEDVIDYNTPPSGQPGLWCQWVPGNQYDEPFHEIMLLDVEKNQFSTIVWNQTEKFYNYVPWLKYLIDNFLIPWGYVLNGEVEWQGEDSGDFGKIIVVDNVVKTKKGKRFYE